MTEMKETRVVMVLLDGVPIDAFSSLAREGVLPNLRNLMNTGSFNTLNRSTIQTRFEVHVTGQIPRISYRQKRTSGSHTNGSVDEKNHACAPETFMRMNKTLPRGVQGLVRTEGPLFDRGPILH